MTLDRPHVLLSSFVALVAWGIAVRLAPFLWHLVNAFFIGCLAASFLVLALALTTTRSIQTIPKPLRRPIPAFTLPSTWPAEQARYQASLLHDSLQLHPTSPAVTEAIGQLVHLALRDFISSWYKAISPSPTFVDEVDKNIRAALVELRDRILQEDVTNMVVARIVPVITNHLREFDSAERVVRGRALNRNLPESEELDLAIAAKYSDGHLHPDQAWQL